MSSDNKNKWSEKTLGPVKKRFGERKETFESDSGLEINTTYDPGDLAGFAREDEANCLAYFACRQHSDPEFRYSGPLVALRYLLERSLIPSRRRRRRRTISTWSLPDRQRTTSRASV